MKEYGNKLRNDSGFSLMELLIVTLVISIVAGLALMQFGSAREQLQRQNVAQQLKQAFERARFDSVKRRADPLGTPSIPAASVIVNTNSYTLVIDANADGDTIDTGETFVTSFTGQTIIPGPGSSATLPVTVSFDKRGEVAAATPIFLVCNPTCTVLSRSNSNANIVLVTPTGTVNLLAGSATVPTFSAPTVSTVGTGVDIKPDVVVP